MWEVQTGESGGCFWFWFGLLTVFKYIYKIQHITLDTGVFSPPAFIRMKTDIQLLTKEIF